AVINLCEALRLEAAHYGISVQVINPGFVRTPLTNKNKFEMPFLIEVEDAVDAMVRGLADPGRFEITFPWRFAMLMKLLRILPYRLYFPLVARMTGFGGKR
nr:oxidoreductase [Alphaproteobacteria bacterium]